jgi:hypothetical protein
MRNAGWTGEVVRETHRTVSHSAFRIAHSAHGLHTGHDAPAIRATA